MISILVRFYCTLIIACSLIPSLGHSSSKNLSSARLQAKAAEMVRQQDLRQNPTYDRIFKMCSVSFERSKLAYVFSSLQQVSDLSTLDRLEVNRMRAQHTGLSTLLYNDLNDPAFYAATNDCGMGQDQRDYFVMSLITLDLSGKLLGAAGAYGLFKASLIAMEKLRSVSTMAYHAVTAAGAAYTALQLYKNLKNPANTKKATNSRQQAVEKISSDFNTEAHLAQANSINQQVIEILNVEKSSLTEALANLLNGNTVNKQLESQLKSKILSIDSKLIALQN